HGEQHGEQASSLSLHHPPKAKRIIYLCQSGAPSQMDLFDPKPAMAKRFNENLPESIRKGQRLTTMTSGQTRFPVAPSIFSFSRHGRSGMEISELLPHTGSIADRICLIRSMHTEAINHDPAITFLQTGFEQAGRPSLGAWLSYGLGSVNADLPAFVVMLSRGSGRPNCQPLYDRLWGSGFLPSRHQGVKFLATGDPVLFLQNPPGSSLEARRENLDSIAALNHLEHERLGDPETLTRIAQYEMAFRMQTSVPEVTDLSDEPESTFHLYGEKARQRGTYAANCLLARRLIEKGVRFVQLYHMGWDQHNALPKQIRGQCHDTDQPSAALVKDLHQRGLLEDTLVIWAGEFGRTIYSQGELTADNYGRDHHPRCFSLWLAGAGIKPGHIHGSTDDFCYNIEADPVHIHDLNATLLHLLGLDHERLTWRHQGRDFRLTDVHGHLVKGIMS
ncbi:MAG TPA: sulfatase, partial [Verrucomicrobiales bacterium]|nr:sulfatase [Verrucomicrobiales bacterium]